MHRLGDRVPTERQPVTQAGAQEVHACERKLGAGNEEEAAVKVQRVFSASQV
jgi:hypothetical protein